MRHRAMSVAIALVMAISACGGDAGSTTTATETTTTSTTTAPTTTTEATTTTTVESTTTAPPETTQPEQSNTWAVVLVAPDDVLNARDEPLGDILFTLGPTDTGIMTTGAVETLADGDLWREIEIGGQVGWVNSRFITEEIPTARFEASETPEALVDDLSAWAADGTGPDWESIVGPKGFNVIHFDSMKTWPPSQNPFLDQTVYDWGGEATGPGQPVASDTFADQVGASFAGVVGDQDLQTAVNQPLQGPEAAPPFVPVQFQNFDYLAFHDPGDDPDVDGLDWTTWYVYFDWTGTDWALVGMSLDAWAP